LKQSIFKVSFVATWFEAGELMMLRPSREGGKEGGREGGREGRKGEGWRELGARRDRVL